jgi:taurine--2-oxoglutarate transaminase
MVELGAACKANGLWPFTHFNRLHVVPPLVISDDDMRQGLDIIDEALTVADNYYTGK